MKKREKNVEQLRCELFERYPELDVCKKDIELGYEALLECYKNGGKVLIAGNGGSASDSEHIVGELLKSFLFLRRPNSQMADQLKNQFGEEGAKLADVLEGALPAIPLTSLSAISTAFANDTEPKAVFAQMVNGLGRKEDIFLGISTSGNSRNILLAFMTAKAKGMKTVLLTGGTGGACRKIADITICVPEEETFKIQELHLPIYHTLCAMLEYALFEEK